MADVIGLHDHFDLYLHSRDNYFRAVLHFLIEQWPQALIAKSNFGTTPVETVAVKEQSRTSKFKNVSNY